MNLNMAAIMETNSYTIGKNFNLPVTIIPITEDALKQKTTTDSTVKADEVKKADLTFHCIFCTEYFTNPFQIYEHLNTHHNDNEPGSLVLQDKDITNKESNENNHDDDDDKDYSWVLEPVCELTDLDGNEIIKPENDDESDTESDTDDEDDDDDEGESSSVSSTSSSNTTSTDTTTITNSNPNTLDEVITDNNLNYEVKKNSIQLKVADPHESTSIILLDSTENGNINPSSIMPVKRGRGRKSAAETAALQLSSLHNKEPKCFQCAHCEASFLSAGDLSKHVRCHITNKPFQCSICEKTFTHIGSLNTHIRIHSGEKPYKCEMCSKAFTQSSSLMVHVRSHAIKKPHQCHLCDKGFINSTSLMMHLKLHEHGERFSCQECDKTFRHEAQLEEHTKTHTKILLFQCSICRLAFPTSSQLVQHMKCHMGEKPFTCSLCDRSFTQSGSLNIHMRIHTGEKPFQCKMCDKSFTQASSLSVHMKIHSGEKPFPCQICGKSYSQAAYLNKHIHNHLEEQKRLLQTMTPQNNTETLLCIVCGALHPDANSLALHITQEHAALLHNSTTEDETSMENKSEISEEEKQLQHQQYMQQVELLMQMQQQMIEEVSKYNIMTKSNSNDHISKRLIKSMDGIINVLQVTENDESEMTVERHDENDIGMEIRQEGQEEYHDSQMNDTEMFENDVCSNNSDNKRIANEDFNRNANGLATNTANDDTPMQNDVYPGGTRFDDDDDYAAQEEVETAH